MNTKIIKFKDCMECGAVTDTKHVRWSNPGLKKVLIEYGYKKSDFTTGYCPICEKKKIKEFEEFMKFIDNQRVFYWKDKGGPKYE